MFGRSARVWLVTLCLAAGAAVLPAASLATDGDTAIAASCGAPGESSTSFGGFVADLADVNAQTSAADFTATVDWGDGATSAGSVSGDPGSFHVNGGHHYDATGPFTVTTTITGPDGASWSTECRVLVYGFAPGGGAFVVGDETATGKVTFWGAQWWKDNSASGGPAPASFKGFAANAVAAPSCLGTGGSGSPWSTDPGNSTPPPAGPLPEYMAVIVSSEMSKTGPEIHGNTVRVAVVHMDPGYEGNPGHEGTGTVVVSTVSSTGCDL